MNAAARILFVVILLFAPTAGAGRPTVEIRGNRAIIDEVYLSLLQFPEDAAADERTARRLRAQVIKFLHSAGYLLARADCRVEEGKIVIEINEGALEKIVFHGAGTLRVLQAKLNASMPHHVFNRPYLERQLRALKKRYRLEQVTFKLVPVRKSGDLQIAEWVPGLDSLLPPAGDYELHITLGRPEWGVGLDSDLDYDFPDGAVLGITFRERDFVFTDDRWLVGGRVGAKLREHIDSGDTFLTLSRLGAEFQWFTPAYLRYLRSFIRLKGELETQQRPDMLLDLFYLARLESSVNIGLNIRHLLVSTGGGVEEDFMFGVEQLPSPPHSISGRRSFRPFAGLGLDLDLEPGKLRRDRRHRLQLNYRHFWQQHRSLYHDGRLDYQKTFELGWHDLQVGVRGAWLWGEVPFEFEEPVGGRYVRALFGDRWYVREVGGLSLELRLSLARDIFKFSIFHDLALFGELKRPEYARRLQVADSFGLGFHALVLDWLQFNIYYGVGFCRGGDFDHGISASLRKAF